MSESESAMSRWFRVALSAALAMSMAPLFATPVAEPMTRQLMVKFKQEGTARRLLPPQSRLALLAADRGVPLSYVRSMALAANVVALDRDVPFSEAQALAARLATHADVEYAQADRRLQPMLVPNDEFVPKQTYLGNGPAAINAFAAWDVTTGSDNVVVAVVDTGFRPHAGSWEESFRDTISSRTRRSRTTAMDAMRTPRIPAIG